jgi:hypothetical protein
VSKIVIKWLISLASSGYAESEKLAIKYKFQFSVALEGWAK